MTFEVILHLMKNLRLYYVDILKKFLKRLDVKQIIYRRKRFYTLFNKKLRLLYVSNHIIFYRNRFINEYATKKKAKIP